MISQTIESKEDEELLVEVGFASDFQDSIKECEIIKFTSDKLRDKIMSVSGETVLVVTSTINSPKIINAVEEYNRDFIAKTL